MLWGPKPEPGSSSKFITSELSKSYQSMGYDFIKGQWFENWVVRFWSTIWWSGTIKIFKWLKILRETNDNEGLERRPGALYLVMELRHPSHDSELIRGLEKGDSSIVGSSSELVTVPVRAGQALEETTALMSASVTRSGGSARGWRVSEGSGLCQGQSAGVIGSGDIIRASGDHSDKSDPGTVNL